MKLQLENGSTIAKINFSQDASCTGGFRGQVLAQTGHGEWVTWLVDGAGNCFSGHYFGHDEVAAMVDFFDRRDTEERYEVEVARNAGYLHLHRRAAR